MGDIESTHRVGELFPTRLKQAKGLSGKDGALNTTYQTTHRNDTPGKVGIALSLKTHPKNRKNTPKTMKIEHGTFELETLIRS